jgi:TolA-binding protein
MSQARGSLNLRLSVRIPLIALLVALIAMPAIAADAPINRPVKDKWALIIGISKFANPELNLKYPAKDAQDFYNYLTQEANFAPDHVALLTDEQATRTNVLSQLGDKWLPHAANPDDLVVLFLSTHGSPSDMDVGGVNYLVAHDTDIDNLYATGLPLQDLTRMIKARVHSDRILIVLDACHSGAATPEAKGLVRSGNLDPDAVAQGTGQLVISSSEPSQVSWESKDAQNGVFTKYLIESLRTNGNNTKLGTAFQNLKDSVQQEVLRDRGVLQTPVLKSKWDGADLQLAVKPTAPRPAIPIQIAVATPPMVSPSSKSANSAPALTPLPGIAPSPESKQVSRATASGRRSRVVDWNKVLSAGYKNMSLGNVAEAMATFQSKCNKYPDSAACHTALGVSLKKLGKLTQAKSEFRRATEVEPSFADSYYELGAMLDSDKDYSGALQAFERYVDLKPESDRKSAVQERIRFCKEHI